MSDEINILKLVCNRLHETGIPYMLTGSLAANFYATPRMTRDIDIVIEISRFEVSKFFRVFQDDFYIIKESIAEAIAHEGMFNIIHNASVYKIDFVVRKDSLYRDTEFQRRRRIDLDGTPVWIVAPEDLIISKLYWSKDTMSDFQLRDVRNLLSSVKNLDAEYIQKWVRTLELNPVYDKVKSHG